jgi:hypothetical protein
VQSVVATAPDRTWFEQALLIRGLDEDEAIDLAAEFGQAAAIRWHRGEMTVLPTGIVAPVQPATIAVTLRPAPRACPVRDDQKPDAQCVQRGGPYGSGAIHVGALQVHHQNLAIDLLGCRTCDDGRHNDSIYPHHRYGFDSMVIGSRHGGAFWR